MLQTVNFHVLDDKDYILYESNDHDLNMYTWIIFMTLISITLTTLISSWFLPFFAVASTSMVMGVDKWIYTFVSFWFGYGLYSLDASSFLSLVSIMFMMYMIHTFDQRHYKKDGIRIPTSQDYVASPTNHVPGSGYGKTESLIVHFDYTLKKTIPIPLITWPGMCTLTWDSIAPRISGTLYVKLHSHHYQYNLSKEDVATEGNEQTSDLLSFTDTTYYFSDLEISLNPNKEISMIKQWISHIYPWNCFVQKCFNNAVELSHMKRLLLDENMDIIKTIPEDYKGTIQELVHTLPTCSSCQKIFWEKCLLCDVPNHKMFSDLIGHAIVGRFLRSLRT